MAVTVTLRENADVCIEPIILVGNSRYAWGDGTEWCGSFPWGYGFGNACVGCTINSNYEWMWFANNGTSGADNGYSVDAGEGSPICAADRVCFKQVNQSAWPFSSPPSTAGTAYNKTTGYTLAIQSGSGSRPAYKTNDLGNSWTAVTNAPQIGGAGNIRTSVAVTTGGITTLYFVAGGGTLSTPNDGTSWSTNASAFPFSASGLAYNEREDRFYVSRNGSGSSGIYTQIRSSFNSVAWTQSRNLGSSTLNNSRGIDANIDTGTVICTYGVNKVVASRKPLFGAWTDVTIATGVGNDPRNICYVPERGVWYATISNSRIYASYDDGLTWTQDTTFPIDVGGNPYIEHRTRYLQHDF